MDIPGISKTKLAVYKTLAQTKMRRRRGLFLVEGGRAVEATLRSLEPETLILKENERIPDWLPERYFGLLTVASDAEIKSLTTLQTLPDIIGVFKIPQNADMQIGRLDKDLYLMLDGIQDPGNMGTILRIADWFGFDRVFLSQDCVDVYNPKVVQSAMGAIGTVKTITADLVQLVMDNPELPVYGTLLEGKDIYKTELTPYGFIVMGNEGNGMSQMLRDLTTSPLLIPSYAHDRNAIESLNVGVATALVVAEFRRRFNN